jgi:hypothetical protein
VFIGTCGGNAQTFTKYRYYTGIRALWEIGILGYCGFKDVSTHYLHDVFPHLMTAEEKAEYLAKARRVGLNFPNSSAFNELVPPEFAGVERTAARS